jgi:hypothetical protein
MTGKEQPPGDAELRRLLADVRAVASQAVGSHLIDDEAVRYVAGAMPREQAAAVERHVASCDRCAIEIERLLDIGEAWQGRAGEARLERLRVLLREARAAARPAPDCFARLAVLAKGAAAAVWNGPLLGSPDLRAATLGPVSLGTSGLMTLPSSQYFGGEQTEAASDWGTAFAAPASVNAVSDLYTAHGRELPDEAEIFWRHEIWLLQVPISVVPRAGTAVESVAIRLRVPHEPVHFVDVLPRGEPSPSSKAGSDVVAAADLRWNGRADAAAGTRALSDDVVRLESGLTLRPAAEAAYVGRIGVPLLAPGRRLATVATGEAVLVFETSPEFAGGMGCICATLLAEHHVARVPIEVDVSLTVRGVNDVPVRAACPQFTFEVELAVGGPTSSPDPSPR